MSRAERIIRVLPECKPWQECLDSRGERPPDPESLPRVPELPDPLLMEKNGRVVPARALEKLRDLRVRKVRLFLCYRQHCQLLLSVVLQSVNELRRLPDGQRLRRLGPE